MAVIMLLGCIDSCIWEQRAASERLYLRAQAAEAEVQRLERERAELHRELECAELHRELECAGAPHGARDIE